MYVEMCADKCADVCARARADSSYPPRAVVTLSSRQSLTNTDVIVLDLVDLNVFAITA